MALSITGNFTVDCGSGSSLDDLVEETHLALFYPTSFALDHILTFKGNSSSFASFRTCVVQLNGGLYHDCGRATTDLKVASAAGIITRNKWWWVGYRRKTDGVSGDQQLFYSPYKTPILEVPSYVQQAIGTGAVNSNATTNLGIGNGVPTQSFWGLRGRIAFVGIWNRLLSLDEMRYQQRVAESQRVKHSNGNVMWMYPDGLGQQRDFSGNNNHGTMTAGITTISGPVVVPRKYWRFGRTATAFRASNPKRSLQAIQRSSQW